MTPTTAPTPGLSGDCTLLCGDALEMLKGLDACSVDAVVTDPPYELGFMNRKWDRSGIANSVELWAEVLRVAKPGAHLLAFGGTRTNHRMVCAIEDGGWEIRDSILFWGYATGFPKSLNLGEGRGTALKPAFEPVCMARKPIGGTIAATLERYGTGALNIDACRIGNGGQLTWEQPRNMGFSGGTDMGSSAALASEVGRWPANVLLDESAAEELDRQTGTLTSGAWDGHRNTQKTQDIFSHFATIRDESARSGDSGGASRFFYVAKPDRAERDAGLSDLISHSGGKLTGRSEGSAGLDNPRAGAGRTSGGRNCHPTVKPLDLMRYLTRLVTPPGGLVLDCFTGSGTTGMACVWEGFRFIGIDQSAEYIEIARKRIAAARVATLSGHTPEKPIPGQISLFAEAM